MNRELYDLFFFRSLILPYSLQKCQVAHWIHTPLEGRNMYLFWRGQMGNLFRIHHITDIVNTLQTIPPEKLLDASKNPEHQLCLEKNWVVLRWMQAAIKSLVFSLVMNHDTTYICWKKLELHLFLVKQLNHKQLRMNSWTGKRRTTSQWEILRLKLGHWMIPYRLPMTWSMTKWVYYQSNQWLRTIIVGLF